MTAPALVMPFPMRPDFLAQIVIPRDMTKEEAARLCALVTSLAAPSTQMLPPIATMQCSKCKVNRLMAPCPDRNGCPMIGEAQSASSRVAAQEPK